MTQPMDLLNEALEDVEDALAERQFGVSAEVDIDGESKLAFAKMGAEWMLLVKNATTTDAAPRAELLKANRRIRMAAAAVLPTLYAALAKAQDEADSATKRLTDETKALAARIRAEGSQHKGDPTKDG